VAGGQLTAKVWLLLAFVVVSVGAAVTSVYFVIRAVWPAETAPASPSITRAEPGPSPGVPAAAELPRSEPGPSSTETLESAVATVSEPYRPVPAAGLQAPPDREHSVALERPPPPPASAPRAPAQVREPAGRPAGRPEQLAPSTPGGSVDDTGPPPAEAPGQLQLAVTPWAEVSVDETSVGTTPVKPIELAPGTHLVRLVHPGFRPLVRKVVIQAGETTTLEIDLTWEAVPLPPS
jgi:hypothetical protein